MPGSDLRQIAHVPEEQMTNREPRAFPARYTEEINSQYLPK